MSKQQKTLIIREQLDSQNQRIRKVKLTGSRIRIGCTEDADIELKSHHKQFLFDVFLQDNKVLISPQDAPSELRLNGKLLQTEKTLEEDSILIFDAHQLQLEESKETLPKKSEIDPFQVKIGQDSELILHLLQTPAFDEILILGGKEIRILSKGLWTKAPWEFKKEQFVRNFIEKVQKQAPEEMKLWDIHQMESLQVSPELVHFQKSARFESALSSPEFQNLATKYKNSKLKLLLSGENSYNLDRIDRLLHDQLRGDEFLVRSDSLSTFGQSSQLSLLSLNQASVELQIPRIPLTSRWVIHIESPESLEIARQILETNYKSLILVDTKQWIQKMPPEDWPPFDARIDIERMQLKMTSLDASPYDLLMGRNQS